MKCTHIGEKSCNGSCFEIDQEMDAILLIITLFTEFVESSLNQYNNALISYFFVNLRLVCVNYGQRTMHVCS